MTTLEILKAGRKRISKPENWTQGRSARNRAGQSVLPESSEAVCWCSSGVLNAVIGDDCDLLGDAFDALDSCTRGGVINFNDTHIHAEVLAAWDKAIAMQEGEA